MNNEPWVTAAIATDALVADLLLRLKQSSPPSTTTTTTTSPSLHPIGWGDRKSRSKPSNFKGQLQRSPSTPLSWNGGAGTSTSEGHDELSRSSAIYSANRSVKIDLHQNPGKEEVQFVKTSCKLKSEIEIQKGQFVLPDLNETPIYEEWIEL